MLGLRLDKELADRLDRFAARTRRTRSDIARVAVREYLDRAEGRDELRRQAALLAEWERANPDADEDALLDFALADMLDEMDREEAARRG